MAVNAVMFADVPVSLLFSVPVHGFSMDLAVSAYIAVLPVLAFVISLWFGSSGIIDRMLKWYFGIISAVVSAVVLLDAVLYGYWQFKLDVTPFTYFLSSPSAALASAVWWQILLALFVWILMWAGIYSIYRFVVLVWCAPIERVPSPLSRRVWCTVGGVLLAGLLFIPIRGGVTVSTMNLSRAYFCNTQVLNHAAVNPVFSLLYSVAHQDNLGNMYRFYDEDEAAALFDRLRDAIPDSSVCRLLAVPRPDIHIVILESFSSHLMPVLGGEPVAPGLDSIACSALLWNNFYASSFRTDRGIPAILSGYPGQPTTSIMKDVSKTDNLPSLSKSLVDRAGYEASYYYGGDINFTNQLAYLVSAKFTRIVSDKDFPVRDKLSKWGAHDNVLFPRVVSELTPYDSLRPKLRVIQTSSSHEPFDVPYSRPEFVDKRAAAFAFADSCVTSYVNELASRPDWANTLVVLVPDHYGAYPDLTDPVERHRIPLVMTGGALAVRGVISSPGSQIDIAATLLSALGLTHSEFTFSRNMLNPASPSFAFFADPSYIGMITDDNTLIYNLDTDKVMLDTGKTAGANLPYAKAFLQTLYTDLSQR